MVDMFSLGVMVRSERVLAEPLFGPVLDFKVLAGTGTRCIHQIHLEQTDDGHLTCTCGLSEQPLQASSPDELADLLAQQAYLRVAESALPVAPSLHQALTDEAVKHGQLSLNLAHSYEEIPVGVYLDLIRALRTF